MGWSRSLWKVVAWPVCWWVSTVLFRQPEAKQVCWRLRTNQVVHEQGLIFNGLALSNESPKSQMSWYLERFSPCSAGGRPRCSNNQMPQCADGTRWVCIKQPAYLWHCSTFWILNTVADGRCWPFLVWHTSRNKSLLISKYKLQILILPCETDLSTGSAKTQVNPPAPMELPHSAPMVLLLSKFKCCSVPISDSTIAVKV